MKRAIDDALWESTDKAIKQLFSYPIPIIFAREGGQEPKEGYIAIESKLRQIGRSERNTAGLTATSKTGYHNKNTYEVDVEFTFVSSNKGRDIAEGIYLFDGSIRDNPNIRRVYRDNHLSVMRKGLVRPFPVYDSTQWRSVNKLEVVFSIAVDFTYEVDYVDKIVVKNNNNGDIFSVENRKENNG